MEDRMTAEAKLKELGLVLPKPLRQLADLTTTGLGSESYWTRTAAAAELDR